jgi:hypothetical protein
VVTSFQPVGIIFGQTARLRAIPHQLKHLLEVASSPYLLNATAQDAATIREAAAVCQNDVMDYVLDPIEPLAIRVTVAGQF